MEIAPIPNLIQLRVAAPSAAPADLPTTRAIDFRRQQDQNDAYTPGNGQQEDEPNQQAAPESATDWQKAQAADPTPDDANLKSIISLFA